MSGLRVAQTGNESPEFLSPPFLASLVMASREGFGRSLCAIGAQAGSESLSVVHRRSAIMGSGRASMSGLRVAQTGNESPELFEVRHSSASLITALREGFGRSLGSSRQE